MPFSSIWPQIPLLIAGALYMLYMGFAAVNKAREGEEAPPSVSSGETFFATAIDAPDLFTLALHDTGTVGPISEKPIIPVLREAPELSVLYVPDRNPAGILTSFSLFSRPPPQAVKAG